MRITLPRLPLAIISLICILYFPHRVQANPILKVSGNHIHIVTMAANDSSLVLQACLDMPGLQQYYPKNADNSYKPVYVMQVPVAFSGGLAVSKFQQEVVFESRSDVYTNKREAFFIVKSFLIEGSTAKVVFDYNYNYTTTPAALEVILTLEKTGTDWAITNTVTSQR